MRARPGGRRSVGVGEDGEFVLGGLGEGSYAITVVQDGRRIGASSSAASCSTETMLMAAMSASGGISSNQRALRQCRSFTASWHSSGSSSAKSA